MVNKVSEFHNRLAVAVAPFKGQELSQAQILQAYSTMYPNTQDELKWIQASDHSQNHTNRAPCLCSTTILSIFYRVGYGKYRVI
jgi:hypothetical protein